MKTSRKLSRRYRRYRMGTYLHYGSGIVCMIAFFYIIALVGNGDYCLAAKIEDTYTVTDYIVRSLIAFIVIGISIFLMELGAQMRRSYRED